MRIRDHAAKVHGGGLHREITSEETYERVRPYFRRIGITRVADITGLDRIGIPVYNAVMPRSSDVLSIYSGKGFTAADARTSAVMEAIERYAACLPIRPKIVASYDDLRSAGRPAMRPAEHSIEIVPYYRDDQPLYWVAGWDLLADEEVLVPHSAVVYGTDVCGPPCYVLSSSNGLASGNTVEEAICHALAEVIERDSLTLAEIISSHLGYVIEQRPGIPTPPREQLEQLRRRNPPIDPASVPSRAAGLVRRFTDAGIALRLFFIGSDMGVPTVLAASTEDNGGPTSRTHGGYGTDPDIEVALLRAITECAQSRAVDIQATLHRYHATRSAVIDRGGWVWQTRGPQAAVADLPSCPSDDVVADIRFMLERLRACGMTRAIVVDLSPPEVPVHVVRVLVPGVESWSSDRSKIGYRVTRAWNQAIRTLRDDCTEDETAARRPA